MPAKRKIPSTSPNTATVQWLDRCAAQTFEQAQRGAAHAFSCILMTQIDTERKNALALTDDVVLLALARCFQTALVKKILSGGVSLRPDVLADFMREYFEAEIMSWTRQISPAAPAIKPTDTNHG